MSGKVLLTSTAVMGSITAAIIDELHTQHLQWHAIECLKANKLAIHVFNSSIAHPAHYHGGRYAYPLAGHYYDVGRRAKSSEQADVVLISPLVRLYETPCPPGTKVTAYNQPVKFSETSTWKNIQNRVEVINPDPKTKPITDYLEKTMKRESHKNCGRSAIILSELARS